MWRKNRITRYYRASDATVRLQKADRDLGFIHAILRMGCEYTKSADRIAKRAAHERSVSMQELGKK